jgi:hypothetical protein
VDLLRSVEQPTSRNLANTVASLADAHASVGEVAEAQMLYREAIALHEQAGRHTDAVPSGIRVLELTRAASDADPTAVAIDAKNLADVYRGAGSRRRRGPCSSRCRSC